MRTRRFAPGMAVITFLVAGWSLLAQQNAANHWVGIWSTADAWRPAPVAVPASAPPVTPLAPVVQPVAAAAAPPASGRGGPPPPVQINGQTLRQIVHTTFGGDRLRVVFSN